MCCVSGNVDKKDLLCLFRGVLDDIHALTGRRFITGGKFDVRCL